ncbi:MAG: DUF3309 family protein [Flavobacteriia bacterium]|nr:DUF3309 family protein [Flavobacteriia bacterium]
MLQFLTIGADQISGGGSCGYGFGHAGTGVLRTILITVVILILLGRI